MDKVWELQSLPQPRKMLLLSIADHASDEGVAWPAATTLMRKCSLKSESGVYRAIKELVALGWLTKVRRQSKVRKGRHQQDSNLYQINLVKLYAEAALYERVPRAPSPTENNEPAHGEGSCGEGSSHDGSCDVKNDAHDPAPRTPDPSLTTDPSLNPAHNAREGDQVVPPKPVPEYPGQPGIAFSAALPGSKFPMHADWIPSGDFRMRAAYWGFPVPDNLLPKDLKAALANFIDYWRDDGKVFSQTQWEQKFARHLQNVKPAQPRGNSHAELDPDSTANPAVRKIRAARAQWEREQSERLAVLGDGGGDLLQPLDGQKRIGAVGPMDCSDWEFDQRPDDERL